LADTLTIGNYVYTFVSGETTSGYNIAVRSPFDSNSLASSIKTAIELSNNPDIIIDNSNNENSTVALKAKVSGTSGNNIELSSTNSGAISITPFSGGRDKTELQILMVRRSTYE
jgi:phage tail sheath gpL-like